MFLVSTSLRVESFCIFWLSIYRTNTQQTDYIGKGLAINRAMKNFSCNCQQFTDSHENKFIAGHDILTHCITVIISIRETQLKYIWGLVSRQLLNLIFIQYNHFGRMAFVFWVGSLYYPFQLNFYGVFKCIVIHYRYTMGKGCQCD